MSYMYSLKGVTLNNPFCSSDIESLVQDSSKVCSAIIPNEFELIPWFFRLVPCTAVVVDWHSSTICGISKERIRFFFVRIEHVTYSCIVPTFIYNESSIYKQTV